MSRHLTYFVSDVHLGLDYKDPAAREARFVDFLRSIPAAETESLYMLGDIWDFWYEYRDVVPKGYVRVFSALMELRDAGVRLYFFKGNHDVWAYSYFESLGIKILAQPHVTAIGGRTFCLGHGDGLGPCPFGYRLLRSVFHNRILQALFSCLHPWLAFRLGENWSRHSRLARGREYAFDPATAPIVRFAEDFAGDPRPDFFIFGHYHAQAEHRLENGAVLYMLKDWMDGSPYLLFDATSGLISTCSGHSQNRE